MLEQNQLNELTDELSAMGQGSGVVMISSLTQIDADRLLSIIDTGIGSDSWQEIKNILGRYTL